MFWAFVELGARTQARQIGADLLVIGTNTSEEQAEAVEKFAAERVDAILYSPAGWSAAHDPVARARGIPVVSVEGLGIPGVASLIQTDLGRAAELVTSYLLDQIGGEGKVAHIRGSISPERDEGFRRALAARPGAQLAYEADGKWSRVETARAVAEALAAHPDLRAIFAHSDEMALSAARAVEQAGRAGEVLVGGVDAMPHALQAVEQGRMAATASLEPYQLGMQAIDLAARVARRQSVPPHTKIDAALVTPDKLQSIALAQLGRLPELLAELAESTQRQIQMQEQVIMAQQSTIQELSSPILPVNDSTLVMPLIGAIDSDRSSRIMDAALTTVMEHRARVMVIDISGVAVVDTQVANHLMQMANAIKLLGTEPVLVGIKPEVAQTVVQLGVDLSSLTTRSTLADALASSLEGLRRR